MTGSMFFTLVLLFCNLLLVLLNAATGAWWLVAINAVCAAAMAYLLFREWQFNRWMEGRR